jgi:glycosyltransferase involved in cell wall biosynthesis
MVSVSVIQPGARLHYAVPQILARAEMLGILYTDLHAEHAWIRVAGRALPSVLQPNALRRLLGRRLPSGLPKDRVVDMALETIGRMILDQFGVRNLGTRGISQRLLDRVEASSIGTDDVIYTVLINEDIEALRRLKARGVKIVHECMISPDVARWVREERQLFPGLEAEDDIAAEVLGIERDREKYSLADLVIVPSEFVRDAVVGLGCSREKVSLVPYGLEVDEFAGNAAPVAGRVLFVGSVGLRKGSHYLAAAARILKERGSKAVVRVVGPAPEHIGVHPAFTGPDYVGQVPRAVVKAEFSTADVFVLPTLCEGSAIVHLEALAAGLPVVTTPNCGSVIRDGVEGFIVPVRRPDLIADRIEQIVSDRSLRGRMSENARRRALDYSLDRYRDRLIGALQAVVPL